MSGREGLVGRLTKLGEKVKQSFADEYEVSGNFDFALESWRRLVAWAAAVHEAGGYEKAVEMVIKDRPRAEEAKLTGWLPGWDISTLLFRTVGGSQGDSDRLLAPLAFWIQELREAGISVRDIREPDVMLDFVRTVQEVQAARDVTQQN